ncbi:MAG: hypothetical protein EAZ17_03785, partial [Sphingobacteriales bacterium]
MLDLTDFLDPVDPYLLSEDMGYKEGQIGRSVHAYIDEFPDLTHHELVILGCGEQRGAGQGGGSNAAPDAIRHEFYSLYFWHKDIAIADLGNIRYGATLGDLMGETIRRVFALTTENDFYARFHCEQFTIHGDPALRLYNYAKPDYVIEEPQVKISPNFISIAETSFKVDASFMNLGKAIDKKIVIELKRTYPDNTFSIVRDTISGIHYEDSLSYELPIVATRDKGLNKISITVDVDNVVDEAFETNNTVTKEFYIIEDEARPVYPY